MTDRVIELRVTEVEAKLLQRRANEELSPVSDWGRRTLVSLAVGVAHLVVDPTHPNNELEFPK
jgi:hypothetical protein